VSGTVTRASAADVRAAWESLPEPRVAVAFGACTITGGPYWDSYAVLPGLDGVVPAAVHVPGCPPRPEAVDAALDMVRGEAP
jgi:NADH-quinone oxidoreductase subunit B